MKRQNLIRKIEHMGCLFIRHDGNHDWYQKPDTKKSQSIPRYKEIKE
jgi:mRNA interferase HicA